ncbi:MAG TPA: hypothetical protein VJU59_09140 [Paraburkholderia sp.]|uniref:hypothetical protein n=1 Tax=Paraburkholderia sp. TaxID=1926495 RepID=UPI002B4904C2|nr:hypothetical protein [Paraburkholderia sp.]HKR39829.1 hypothetical protein [Paraburkholderia sp.]
MPHNPRIVKGHKRRAQDTVSPSARGIRTIAPSTIGIQDREYFSRVLKVAKTAGDAIALAAQLRVSGDARAIAAADAALKPIGGLIKALNSNLDSFLNALRGNVDSILREQQASANTDDPTMLDLSGTNNTPSGMDAAATVERINTTRMGIAADQAASFGAANPARVALGLGDEVLSDADLYAHMANLPKNSR